MAGKNSNPQTLKPLIETLELTQKEFSSLTGISESTVSEMLKGKRRVSAGAALKIKKAFPQVSMAYLTSGQGSVFDLGADKEAHDCGTYKIRIRELERENMELKARLYDLEKLVKYD